MRARFVGRLGVSLVSAACGSSTSICPATVRNTVTLYVFDSLTRQPLAAPPTVTFSSSTRTDSNSTITDGRYPLGEGAVGDFTIIVRASGYADWTRSLHVDADACGNPMTAVDTALLQRNR